MNNLKVCASKSFFRRVFPLLNRTRGCSSKFEEFVPTEPIASKIREDKLPPRTKIDADTITLLERLSLVDCANKEGIKTLEDAVAFADRILQVDTAGVEPLVTVLEDRPLMLREDIATDGNRREEILQNAGSVEEDYLVAPPGNIPLESREDALFEGQEEKTRSQQ